ncbi:MAG: DUF1028 domain-containing protein [Candidatus Eremiobacteraeota bacterium]|nr:DUF1028 domain-containing protein [Candidatus Eremiobacteraeota bacterium]
MRLSTFSIVACDPQAKELGVAVQSKFLSVGAAVPWVMGGVGAIATQAWANTTYGPRGLRLLREGCEPDEVVAKLTADDDHAAQRQIGIVDASGRAATFTGDQCMEWAGGLAQPTFAVQGNILASKGVVSAMADAFLSTRGCLADRLLAALSAGQQAGGDRRGQQSAALYVAKPGGGYGGFNDRYIDLRVDDHARPIEELVRILELHKLYFFKAEPHDLIPLDDERRAEIRALLQAAGSLPAEGAIDEQATFKALVEFMHRENLEDRVRDDGMVDRQTLGYLRSYAAR